MNRDLNIRDAVFVDNISWEDENYGYLEDTVEYTTTSNHKVYITFNLSIAINLDGEEDVSIEVEEIYVRSPFGKEVNILDEEYDELVDSFKTHLVW